MSRDFSGGAGGAGSKFAVAPDNLRSNDLFEGVLGLCAGPIKGLTNGLKTLYINGTPLQDATGAYNYQQVATAMGNGDPALFPQTLQLKLGAGAAPSGVGVQLTNPNDTTWAANTTYTVGYTYSYNGGYYQTTSDYTSDVTQPPPNSHTTTVSSATTGPGPWVSHTVVNPNADFIDLRLVVQQLYTQDKNGQQAATANIEINMKPSGSGTWFNPMLSLSTASYASFGFGAGINTWAEPDVFTRNPVRNWMNGDQGGGSGALTITGKTTSPYVEQVRIVVPKTGAYANVGWDIRLRLIEKDTLDADPNFAKRTITWDSAGAGFTTPMGTQPLWKGLAWFQIGLMASAAFTGIPDVWGEYDTKVVQVPPASVYAPDTRTYTGTLWDGSWSQAFTNDPAWVINDIISDSVSGLSSITPGSFLNKWDALAVSKWCSQQVPDGKGGTEPRYSLNMIIDQPQKADEIVKFMAGAVGAYAWDQGNGEWRVRIDQPQNPSQLYTLENIEGEFVYAHTDIDTRYNDITMTFLNKDLLYVQDQVRVFDNTDIAARGRKPTKLVAVGCTGRQEALRRAMFRLRSGLDEYRIVSFTTNRQGRMVAPFQTILVADGDLGTTLGDSPRTTGRIVNISADRLTITVRDTMRLELGVAYKLTLSAPNPNYTPTPGSEPSSADWNQPTLVYNANVTNDASHRGDVTVLTLDAAVPASMDQNAQVALSATSLPTLPLQYRVMSVTPVDQERVQITAINVSTTKQSIADNVTNDSTVLVGPSVTVPPPLAPPNGSFLTLLNVAGHVLLVANWDRPASPYLQGFLVTYSFNDGPPIVLHPNTIETTAEVADPVPGKYSFSIQSIDRRGQVSLPYADTVTVTSDGRLIDWATQVRGTGKPADNATVGAVTGINLSSPIYGTLSDSNVYTGIGTAAYIANQASTATNSDFSVVTGATKPANNATRNVVTYATTAPASPVDGDLWVDTSGTYAIFKLRSGGAWVTGATALTAYNALSGKPVALADINTTESSKLAGIAAGADVTSANTAAGIIYQGPWATSKVSVQSTAPTSPATGDIWYDTTTPAATSQKRWDGSTWVVLANNISNTSNLTDGASLGQTALWGSVSGTGKPFDYATVGAKSGTNLQKSDGTILTDALVVTSLGTANYVYQQSPWVTDTSLTPTKVGNRTQYLDDTSGSFSDLGLITNRRITRLNRADGVTAVTEAAVVTDQGTAHNLYQQGAWATAGVAVQSTTPSSPTTGDIWFDTSTTVTRQKRWDGASWVVVANNITDTNQIGDSAGLGTTATWGNVTSRPANVASLTGTEGILNSNISSADANTSNILRRSSGGLFTGELTADTTGTHTAQNITSQGAWATAAVAVQGTAPTTPTAGDIWFDTSTAATLQKRWNGSAWLVMTNYITNTNQVTDGASLGQTAAWGNVSSRPANVAALNGSEGILNSAITINSNGALSGAGAGQVTIGGLGYSGELNATYGARIGTNLKRADGTTNTIESDIVTSQGQANSLYQQSLWATYSTLTPAQLTGATSNMLANPTATLGLASWTVDAGSFGTTAGAGEGSYFYGANPSSNTPGLSMYQDVGVYGNGAYSLQALIYAGGLTGTGSNARCYIEWLDSSKAHISYSNVLNCPPGQGWLALQAPNMTAPSTAAYARVRLDVYSSGAWSSTSVAWRKVKLEGNTVCTPFSDEATYSARYNDFTSLEALKPQELGANATEGRTARYVYQQSPWVVDTTLTPTTVSGRTARLNGTTGNFDDIANITNRQITRLKRNDNTTAIGEADVITNQGQANTLYQQSAWATYTGSIASVTAQGQNFFPYPRGTTDGRSAATLGWQSAGVAGFGAIGMGGVYEPFGGGYYQVSRTSGAAGQATFYYDVPINPGFTGQSWAFSFNGYPGGGTSLAPYIQCINSARDTQLAIAYCTQDANSGRWGAVVVQPAGTAYLRIAVVGNYPATSGAAQDCTFWAVKLENGASVTPYNEDGSKVLGGNVQYADGSTVNSLQPQEVGANVTEGRTAHYIQSQSILATNPSYAGVTNVPGVGTNHVVNSDFKRNFYGWNLISGAAITLPNGLAYSYTCNFTQSAALGAGANIDFAWQVGAWGGTTFAPNQFMMPVTPGDVVYAQCMAGQKNCTFALYILMYDGAGTLISASSWTGATDYGTDTFVGNGDPAHYTTIGGVTTVPASCRWAHLMMRVVGNGSGTIGGYFIRPAMGKLATGQTTLPAYQSGPSDPFSDRTSDNTAKYLNGQSLLATNPDFANVTGSTKPANNADVTLTNIPPNISVSSSYVYNPQLIVSYVGITSISMYATTVTTPTTTYNTPTANVTGLTASTTYAVFYDLVGATYVALSSGATSYYASPSRYIYMTKVTTQTSSGTGGSSSPPGGGIQPLP